MRMTRAWLLGALASGLLLVTGCATGDLDDADTGNVVLTVQALNIPTVTTSDPGTGCIFTVTDADATLLNTPKSAAATSAFNDVQMSNVSVSYVWDDPALTTNPETFGISGTVEVGGTGSVTFPPISLGNLSGALEGHTANLTLVFLGRTSDGTEIRATSGGSLSVNSCP